MVPNDKMNSHREKVTAVERTYNFFELKCQRNGKSAIRAISERVEVLSRNAEKRTD